MFVCARATVRRLTCTRARDFYLGTFYDYDAYTTSTTYGMRWNGCERAVGRCSARCERVHVKTMRLCLYNWRRLKSRRETATGVQRIDRLSGK